MAQSEDSLDFSLITQVDRNLLIKPETEKVFYVDDSIYFSNWVSMQFHKSKVAYYYISLIFFIGSFFLVWLLNRSKLGYRLRAIRDQSDAASSLGIHVSKYKIIAFIISAMIMAPMGSIYAQYVLIVDPNNAFNVDISILVLLISVTGFNLRPQA